MPPKWNCARCTFLNSAKRKTCAQCATKKDLKSSEKRRRSVDTSSPLPHSKSRSETQSPLARTKTTSRNLSQQGGTPKLKISQTQAFNSQESIHRETKTRSSLARSASAEHSAGKKQTDESEDSAVPMLFATASGKPVSIGTSSLKAAAACLEEPAGRAPTFFATASGRPVSINSESLKSAAACLEDDKPSAAPTLFASASKKPISVRTENLRVAAQRLERAEVEETENAELSTPENANSVKGAGKLEEDTIDENVNFFDLRSAPQFQVSSAAKMGQKLLSTSKKRTFVPPKRFSPPRQKAPTFVAPLAVEKLQQLAFDTSVYSSFTMHPSVSLSFEEAKLFRFPAGCVDESLGSLMQLDGRCTTVGPEHLRNALLSLGAVEVGCSPRWVHHHWAMTVWRLASASHFKGADSAFLSPLHILSHCVVRYNKEYVKGQRSALRLVAEKDAPASRLMCLVVVSVFSRDDVMHTQSIELSDGWYVMRAALDLPLTHLAKEGLLVEGQKLLVWGASINSEQGYPPLDLPQSVNLAIHFNGVKPATAECSLGFVPNSPIPVVPLKLIDVRGGLVPSICGRISRILPSYFQEWSATDKGGRVIRNAFAERQCCEKFEAHQMAEYEDAIQTMSREEAGKLIQQRLTREVVEVRTFILECEAGHSAFIQVWRNPNFDDLKEGQGLRVFSLSPSRFFMPAPFSHLKLLHAKPKLICREIPIDSNVKLLSSEELVFKREFSEFASVCDANNMHKGHFVDCVCVVVGVKQFDAHNSALIFCSSAANVFGLLEISSSERKIIQFPPVSAGCCCALFDIVYSSYDESGAFNIVRFVANEYSSLSQRPSNSLAAKLKELERNKRVWEKSVEIGQQLLSPDYTIRRELSDSIAAMFSVPTFFGGQKPQSSTREANGSTSTQLAWSSVKLQGSLIANPQSPMNCTRTLFTPVHCSCAAHPIASESPTQATSVRHLFGNVECPSLEVSVGCTDLSTTYPLHGSVPSVLRATSLVRSATASTPQIAKFELRFAFNVGQGVVESLICGDTSLLSIAGSLAQLSTTCSVDDVFVLWEMRDKVLRDRDPNAHWAHFLIASVVLRSSDIVELGDDKPNTDHLGTCGRWNGDFVPSDQVLWWHESEWEQLINALMVALTNRLFKITVLGCIAEKIYSLCEATPIETLFE